MDRRPLLILLALAGSLFGQDQVSVIQNSFNAGELSPLLRGRADFPKYNQGCQTLENMLPLTQGPVRRRPGTRYIATTKNSGAVRLIPFEYSTDDAYIVELGNLYARFYRAGAQILTGAGAVYEIVTPFDSEELSAIQYVQSANTMYLVDGNDAPQALTRTGHAAWTIEDVNFTTGPFLPRDTTGTTLTMAATTGSNVNMVSSASLFQAGHVGSIWKLYHRRATTSVSGVLDANEVTDPNIAISGEYSVVTHGTWTAILSLQRSYDSGATWETIKAIASTNDNNMDVTGTEDETGAIYRLEMSARTSGSATYTISALTYLDSGVVKVTSYSDPCTVKVTVLDEVVSTDATAIWQEGYWSGYRGWPKSVEFHEQRLWFGGSTAYPQTLWASQTAESEGDYENMTAGTNADSALIFTLPGKNPIRWLFSQTYLMVGTSGGVGRLGSATEATTPSNVDYKMQSKTAAAALQPASIADVLLYVERGGRKVRQYLYSMDVDQFISPDITILSEHITSGGLTGMALQLNPEPILWSPRADGELVTMTYLKEQGVAAWARQTTHGTVESVAVIPGATEDEVWCSVQRTINGSAVRYVEQFQPQNWGTDQNDCWFVDSGLDFDGGAAVSITAVTKANPGVVTVAVWPTDGDGTNLADGDQIVVKAVVGMTQLNGNTYTVHSPNVGAKTFQLRDELDAGNINTMGFSTYTSGGTVQRVENTFGGLDHLEGETVAVWADGMTRPTQTVDANTVTLGVWVNRCLIGLSYTSTVKSMPLIPREGTVSPVGPRRKLVSANVDFYETTGAEIGDDTNFVNPDREDAVTDAAPELYSGWKDVLNLQGGFTRDPVVVIRQTNPAPMTVRQFEASIRSSR